MDMNTLELIHEAERLFQPRLGTAVDGTPVVTGLLYPTPECELWHYNMPALAYELKIISRETGYQFQAVISSIDDSGVTIYGPVGESVTKAVGRLEKFQFFLQSTMYACPSKAEIESICTEIRAYAGYW